MSTCYDDRPLDEVSREEAWSLVDEAARRWLGVSGDEFAKLHDKGEIDDDARAMHVASLLDLARQ
jgi:hypothetical protein